MNQLEENWKFNVSKKIAQLTKVIFRLHSESLDRRDLVAQVRKKCDEEISAIVMHSNEVINEAHRGANEYRQSIESLLRSEYESKFDEIKEVYSMSKDQIQNDFQTISNHYEDKVSDLQNQVTELMAQTEKAELAFQRAADHFSQDKEILVNKLEAKQKKEIEDCIQKSNEKINQLILEHAKKEEEIKLQMQKELVEQKRQSNSNSNQMREQLKKRIFELENSNRSLESQLKKNTITITNLKSKLEKAAKQIADAEDQNQLEQKNLKEQLENKINEINQKHIEELTLKDKEIETLNETIENNQKQFEANLQEKNDEWSQKVRELYIQIEKLQYELSKSSGITDQMFNDLLKKHEDEKNDLKNKHDEEIESLQLKEERLRNDYQAMQKQYLEEIENIKKLHETEKAKLRIEMSKMKNAHSEEIEKLNSDYQTELNQLKVTMEDASNTNKVLLSSANKELLDLKVFLAKEKTNHEIEIQEFSSRKSHEINALKQNHQIELDNMSNSYENKIKGMDEQYKKQIEELIKSNESQIKAIEEKNELNLRLSIEKQNVEMEKRNSIQLGLMRDALDKEIQSYKDSIKMKEEEIKNLNEENQRSLRLKNDIISDLNDQILEVKKKSEVEISNIISANNEQLTSLKNEIELQKSRFDEEKVALIAKYKEKLKIKKSSLNELETQRMNQISQLRIEFDQDKEKYQKQIELLNAEIQRLRSQCDQIAAEYEAKMKTIVDEKLKEEAEIREKQKEELINERRNANESRMYLQSQADTLNDQLKASKKMYQSLLEEMETFTDSVKKEELKRFTEYEQQRLKELNEQAQSYQSKIDDLNGQIKNLNEIIEKERIENFHKVSHLEKSCKDQIDTLKTEHEDSTEKMKTDYESQINDLNQRIAELEVTIEDWEEKFRTRDARPEDVQKIMSLEESIKEKSDTLTKLFIELKHYQNELINREISYNKLFNVNPNIGELNVIEKKIKVENLITESKTKTLRFLPKLSDDRDKDMKFLKTTSTPRRKAVSSLNTQKSKEKVNSKGVSSSLAATASALKSVGGNSNSSTLILNPQSPSQQSNSNLRKSTPS